MKLDYKELWQEFYENSIEDGMTEDEAELFATEAATDHFAALADDAHDRAKERGA